MNILKLLYHSYIHYMASADRPVNADVFIMIHGGVKPVINPVWSHIDPLDAQKTHYTVTATTLPTNISLYAPAILGYSYYKDNTTEDIVKQAALHFKKNPSSNIIDSFLRILQRYEQSDICKLKKHLDTVVVPHGYDRTEQLFNQEMHVVRTQMEWRRYSHYIKEKRYQIYPDEDQEPSTKLSSCIMIYFDHVRRDKEKDNVVNEIITSVYNSPHTTYILENREQVKYTVTYDEESSTFKIDFGETDVKDVSFDDIIFLIRNLILTVGPPGTRLSDIKLSIVDLTCDDFSFTEIDMANERPVLLSSVDSREDPTLVFGTIQEGRALALELQTQTRWPSLSSRDDESWDSYQLGVTSVSPSPSPSHSHSLSHSHSQVPVRPSNTHVVHLTGGVETFVNFKLLSECRPSSSQSPSISMTSQHAFVSPQSSIESSYYNGSSPNTIPSHSIQRLGGGSRRRRRRTKKEVYRKNVRKSNRRRRRGTKGRTNTKRRNTKHL